MLSYGKLYAYSLDHPIYYMAMEDRLGHLDEL